MIGFRAIGGYSEVGRNMTLISYNNESVIFDMGIHLENLIRLKGDEDSDFFSLEELKKAKAIPQDNIIKNKKNVLAIAPSHGHLDHIGAIPYMAARYNCPIICTPYTAAVINAIIKDKGIPFSNKIIAAKTSSKIRLSKSLYLEFVNITHSIPHSSLVVLHTPEGKVVYSNDFKLDNTPVLGKKPDYKRICQIGNSGVKLLILDSLYSHMHRKTPSELIAKEMLQDVLLNIDSKGKAIIVTTFSSHIARLKTIAELGKKIKRKIVFLGRSLAKYAYAAESIGLFKFSKYAEICKYKRQIKKALKKIEKARDKYLIVCTGHQAEPKAVLSKIVEGSLGFEIRPNDHVVFSCNIIPGDINIKNREILEKKLDSLNARIFKDVHASGHASREDHRELINMLKPENIIPAHAPKQRALEMIAFAESFGYKKGKTIFLVKNKDYLEF